jgi:hypothetical protein
MQRFRYLRDSLFLAGCTAYALNRFLIEPRTSSRFLHSYFNDLWLVPCALPPVLWLHRKLGLRKHDNAPGILEIGLHLIFWSALFEWLGPRFVAHATADAMDTVIYTIGAIGAAFWWRRRSPDECKTN